VERDSLGASRSAICAGESGRLVGGGERGALVTLGDAPTSLLLAG
jgi:hypothetical protein